jgi:hypothetical protein
VVALGELAERGADLGVAGLVADAEHEERVQLLERLGLRVERLDQVLLGGGHLGVLVDRRDRRDHAGDLVNGDDRHAADRGGEPLVLRRQRALDQPDRAGGDRRQRDLDAAAALRVLDVAGHRALEHDHRGAGQREIDAHDGPDVRRCRRSREHRVVAQTACRSWRAGATRRTGA